MQRRQFVHHAGRAALLAATLRPLRLDPQLWAWTTLYVFAR